MGKPVTRQRQGEAAALPLMTIDLPASPAKVFTRHLKGIGNVLNTIRVPLRIMHKHNVKATELIPQPMPGKILRRQAHQPGLFSSIHGVHRTTECMRTTRFHLHEHEHLTILRDEIQFPGRRSGVPIENPVSLATEIPFSVRFPLLPEQLPRIQHRPPTELPFSVQRSPDAV